MTLNSTLEQAGATRPDGKLFFLKAGEVVEDTTFVQLHEESGRVATHLRQCGVERGHRVAIALPNSLGFLHAFFGILAAGAVAVPLPPPFRFASLDIHMRKISLALRQSGVRLILADRMMADLLRPLFGDIDGRFEVICLDDIHVEESTFVEVDEKHPALIQYTSGTSGTPKGVILTHANLISNIEAIRHPLKALPTEVGCSWLPLFHDMGLIGQALVPIACGGDSYLLRPEDFLKRPLRWLQAISDHGCAISTAPSSGYAHCIRHISDEEVATLDLSRWRLALNGSEMVDGRVMRDFAAKFGPAGFRLEAFLPVYGLAEATLAVTFPPVGRPPTSVWARRGALSAGIVECAPTAEPEARELVSVGTAVARTEYRVVGTDGVTPVPDNHVGAIVVRGDGVSAGYEGDDSPNGAIGAEAAWVQTGDLGAEVDGELYVVGRAKEVIVVFGQNYYATDIEAVASSVPDVPSRGVLATSALTNGGEGGLLVFIETDESSESVRDRITTSVRQAVSTALGLSPERIVFLPKGRIDRTSSGKIRRDGIEALVDEYCPRPRESAQQV